MNIETCCEEAYSTYEQLLSKSGLSSEKYSQYLIQFEKSLYLAKEQIEHVLVSELIPYVLHPYEYKDLQEMNENLIGGVIIVVSNNRGRKLIIDGNHRVNSLKNDPQAKLATIEIKAYVPKLSDF